MSRIGKNPIPLPQGVSVTETAGSISVKGPKGELKRALHPDITVEVKDNFVTVLSRGNTKKSKALWGLFHALIANMVRGVISGFEKKLEIEGIGFRVTREGDGSLTLALGFSHPVKVKAPEGITFNVEKNAITVSGINNELVGEVAASIRGLKPPEPYKGKGIRYQGEIIRRKAGKKAVASA